jgi:hypothetical protein
MSSPPGSITLWLHRLQSESSQAAQLLWKRFFACMVAVARQREAALRDLHARFPDYLFGRSGVARLDVFAGRLDRAEELLAPLELRGRMRAAAFVALATVKIELARERSDLDEARMLASMWADLMPDHPYLARIRNLIEDSHP